MFEGLADRLQETFKKLRGHGKLTEDDVNEAMRDVRMALLEADVNFKVVKQFIKTVKERAVGQEVMENLTPAQLVVKIVNEELTTLLGGSQSKINIQPNPPTIIMMVGLQGAGKTTAASKLAARLAKEGRKPMLAACDLVRPAAIQQLCVLGEKIGVPVHHEDTKDAVKVAKDAIKEAKKGGYDTLIIDTAGRLQIDQDMMAEIAEVKKATSPDEVLLVADAMTG